MADIKNPGSYVISTHNINAKIVWDDRFIANANAALGKGGRLQHIIDEAVLVGVEPYIPRLEGQMYRSGRDHTIVGSGLVTWKTPYVRVQWFGVDWRTGKPLVYHGGGIRGSYWAIRWAADHLNELEANINREAAKII